MLSKQTNKWISSTRLKVLYKKSTDHGLGDFRDASVVVLQDVARVREALGQHRLADVHRLELSDELIGRLLSLLTTHDVAKLERRYDVTAVPLLLAQLFASETKFLYLHDSLAIWKAEN